MKKITYLFLITALCGCNYFHENKDKQEKYDLYNSWLGKKLILPKVTNAECMHCKTNYFVAHNNIIFAVFDVGCSSCLQTLASWEKFRRKMDRRHVDLVFIIPPETYEMYKNNVALFQNHNVYVDKDYVFQEANHLSPKKELQTFLVDHDNVVQLMGNPMLVPQLQPLYDKYLNGQK